MRRLRNRSMSLVSTPINYTCTNLAEHLEGMSHDAVSDFLKRERLTEARELVAAEDAQTLT